MFTGLVEETGKALDFRQGPEGWRLRLKANLTAQDCQPGDSIAVNGCCLTVTEVVEGQELCFDLLEQTVRLTSFREVHPDSLINLERSLPANGRLGGHFVTGHIDGTGTVAAFERRGNDVFLRIRHNKAFLRYVAERGSIAVDGVSLTVAEVFDDGFAVWLIPHTLEVTRFQGITVGNAVNLEFDLLARYMERLLDCRRTESTLPAS